MQARKSHDREPRAYHRRECCRKHHSDGSRRIDGNRQQNEKLGRAVVRARLASMCANEQEAIAMWYARREDSVADGEAEAAAEGSNEVACHECKSDDEGQTAQETIILLQDIEVDRN